MAVSQQESIRMKFRNHTYSLLELPCALYVYRTGVYLNKDSQCEDVLEALDKENSWDSVLTPKLKADFAGDVSLSIRIVKAEWFSSRQEFETVYSEELFKGPFHPDRPVKIKQISFEKAVMDHLHFEISCNMDYYLANPKEIENDIGKKFECFSVHNYDLLEKELFFIQCVKIFGDENDQDEKAKCTVIFKDFHILYEDGHEILATAKRGNNYIILSYEY